MFCKVFILCDIEDWEFIVNINNFVEFLNCQFIGEGCSNILVLMKNIYLEDWLYVVKIVVYE